MIRHRTVETNGIAMHVAEAGDEGAPLVVLCHGWPELWFSWRHQLSALADAGYWAVAPDQRGYGRTSIPKAVEDYDIFHLTDDLCGLLDALGRERAVFVGHDWGSIVVWNMAQRFPERVDAVMGMSVAFSPRGSKSLIARLREVMGDRFFYMLHFQQPAVADAELAKDPHEVMRRFLGGGVSLLTSLPAEGTTLWDCTRPVEVLPSWLSEEELDVFGSEFSRTGFTGGINWYRNFDRNWELSASYGERRLSMPAGFVAGADDPVLLMAPPSRMEGWVLDLRVNELVPGAGHWVQQEKPAETNAALLRFLGTLGSPGSVGSVG